MSPEKRASGNKPTNGGDRFTAPSESFRLALCIRCDPVFGIRPASAESQCENVRPANSSGVDQFYCPIMGLYALEHHRQPDAGAADLPALFPLCPGKKASKIRRTLMIREFLGPESANSSTKLSRGAGDANPDNTAFWRELDGIGQQIVEHGTQLVSRSDCDDNILDVEFQLNVCCLQRQDAGLWPRTDNQGPNRETRSASEFTRCACQALKLSRFSISC